MTSSDPAERNDVYGRSAERFREPPEGFWATVGYLGPGLILVGSVVGSGELIMTTKLGAQAGFVLLWFVILSCLIKVVVQAELVRHIVSSGETVLEVFNGLPGPSGKRPAWLTLSSLASLAMVSMTAVTIYMRWGKSVWTDPIVLISGSGLLAAAAWVARVYWTARPAPPANVVDPPRMNWFLWVFLLCQLGMFINGGAILGGAGQSIQLALPEVFGAGGARYWALLVAVLCAALLLGGKYESLERVSIGLVASFTLISVVCTGILQWTDYGIGAEELFSGLMFRVPQPLDPAVIMTVLAVYAGTGIGHWEMLAYTYWCIEKGYVQNTGANQPGELWTQRARGWIRVMYIDALLTMVVYTLTTVCFYLLGAAILHRQGQDPAGTETLSILQGIYTESLGDWAATLFVIGAFFVLFSTTVSGVAASSRILADAICVMGFVARHDFAKRLRLIRICVILSLVLHAYAYFLFDDPPLMLTITAVVAVFIYPTLGLGTIYLRYRRVDPRIRPGRFISALLWICGLALGVLSPAMIVVAIYLTTSSG